MKPGAVRGPRKTSVASLGLKDLRDIYVDTLVKILLAPTSDRSGIAARIHPWRSE
jgi:hypothetical protein